MADELKVQLSALLEVVQPNDSKICPIMGTQIIQMPVNAASVLTPQGQTVAFVRQFVPCVKGACQLWDDKGLDCKLGLAAAALVDRVMGLK